jgi:hypothetical protein
MIKKGLDQCAQSSSPKWAKMASAVALALAVPATQAVGISWGEWEGSFDSTLSVGASWRVENQSADLIARGQSFDNGGVGNRFSFNGDDGNLNFHKGDTFSEIVKGVHDFGLQHSSGVGFFVRGAWFYDNKYKNGDFRYYGTADASDAYWQQDPQRGIRTNDPRAFGFSDEAMEIHGSDTRLLDAYVYNTWFFDEAILQVRLGEQVVNWGESTFIQHSISEANPIDVTKLRVPGSELKEAFIPVQTLWASLDLTPTITLEGYVQFEWEEIRIDEPGSYFSTQDFVGDAGEFIWLGFTLNPMTQEPVSPLNTARRVHDPRSQARDDGQYGLRLGWFAEDLGATEFGFYYLNYHNKRPVISANKFAISNGGTTGFFEYVEDIELYGISFNTATDGGLSIAGEVSYRIDEPLQVDDVELLFATLEGVSPTVPRGTSQLNGSVAPGEYISGYRLFDTIQGQMTLTNLFGPGLGAEQWTGLLEVGFNQIESMPTPDELRFEAPGTYRSGNPNRTMANGFEGVEPNAFADDFSWGYRVVAKADYKGFIGAWNMAPRIVYQHDVSGITPAPISNFVEGRKAISLAADFDYLKRYKIGFAYNRYFGGGNQNLIADRDFVSLTASYSF